jgi:hypothetical protein
MTRRERKRLLAIVLSAGLVLSSIAYAAVL